ncbi:MAG: AAA family ATPase, partial [Acidimicrobiales bacterium]
MVDRLELPDELSDDEPVLAPLLSIEWASEVAARIDAAPAPRWLAQPVWPEDAYGVIAAEKKAGKTWMILDLAVSVASDTPWLGVYPVGKPGPALLFLGEGGERKMIRRLRSVCESRGVLLDGLPLRLCHRVPLLTSALQLDEIREEIEKVRPAVVIIDPLYLAAAGAKSSDLYAMGAVLSGVQAVCQGAGAALVVVTHWNKTGEGHGAHRMTGAGPAEWGR